MRDDEQISCQDIDNKWVNKCSYCRDKWSYGHKCNNPKSYKYGTERELDTFVNDSNEKGKRKENNCRRCGKNWTLGHRCTPSHSYHCKIIDGKEVEVSIE
jgi:hypothetical protein